MEGKTWRRNDDFLFFTQVKGNNGRLPPVLPLINNNTFIGIHNAKAAATQHRRFMSQLNKLLNVFKQCGIPAAFIMPGECPATVRIVSARHANFITIIDVWCAWYCHLAQIHEAECCFVVPGYCQGARRIVAAQHIHLRQNNFRIVQLVENAV